MPWELGYFDGKRGRRISIMPINKTLPGTEGQEYLGLYSAIGSVGDALDNALMESTVGLYKSELIDQHPTFAGRAELERETACPGSTGRTRPGFIPRSSTFLRPSTNSATISRSPRPRWREPRSLREIHDGSLAIRISGLAGQVTPAGPGGAEARYRPGVDDGGKTHEEGRVRPGAVRRAP
jgi:hypothetical protein